MEVKFCNKNPHENFSQIIKPYFNKAKNFDAAIAFVTKGGISFLRRELTNLDKIDWRIIVGVQMPTDLQELNKLAEDFPNRVWIHLGGKYPIEARSLRFQMHSKVILIKDELNVNHLFVGSHNFTKMALDGVNNEASIYIKSENDNSLIKDVESHFDLCERESEIFDPKKLEYYQLIQGSKKSISKIDSFKNEKTLVIFSEYNDSDHIPDNLKLNFNTKDSNAKNDILYGMSVDLYLYPAGELLNKGVSPIFFSGKVILINDVKSGNANKNINSIFKDYKKPYLEMTTETPDYKDGIEVTLGLERKEYQKSTLYHKGKYQPKKDKKITYKKSSEIILRCWSSDDCDGKPFYGNKSVKDGMFQFMVPDKVNEYTTFSAVNSFNIDGNFNLEYINNITSEKLSEWESYCFYIADYKKY